MENTLDEIIRWAVFYHNRINYFKYEHEWTGEHAKINKSVNIRQAKHQYSYWQTEFASHCFKYPDPSIKTLDEIIQEHNNKSVISIKEPWK